LTGSLLTIAERDGFAAVRERPVVSLALALDGAETGIPQEIRFPRGDASVVSAFVVEPGQMLGRAPADHCQIVALLRDGASARAARDADDVVAKRAMRALSRVRRDLEDRVLATRVARSSVPFFEVGAYRRLERFFRVQADRRALGRRLYWAGDQLAGAGFEAATLSGDRVAAEIASDLA